MSSMRGTMYDTVAVAWAVLTCLQVSRGLRSGVSSAQGFFRQLCVKQSFGR